MTRRTTKDKSKKSTNSLSQLYRKILSPPDFKVELTSSLNLRTLSMTSQFQGYGGNRDEKDKSMVNF
ncbi:hypothetical protein H5410_004358 [Solanum commersonii]|uniref:Uncharacterized protein n=1 Tax=Solanum commersonii TaxID=4109 RepID=A0A9J6B7J5_SOLCO|nr:hypothetical protein H5410_004358 [Solanum commersonii]